MLSGGLLMAVCSYLIWAVPDAFRGGQMSVFWYLVVMNLLLRTGLTMFFIPYLALGFEMCSDYQGRARIQGMRWVFNMIANFAGPAMAWTFFFRDKDGIAATTVEANYHQMGATFAIATAVFVVLVCVFTLRWRQDTRGAPASSEHGWIRAFFIEMKHILADPNPRWVFVFIFVVCVGMVIVSSLQMFVYDDFMHFTAGKFALPGGGELSHTSVAHGSTMVGMGLGALVCSRLTRLFDKKGAVLLGGGLSIFCNLMLAIVFLTGLVKPGAVWEIGGLTLPLALIVFVAFHATYWFGNGIMLPVSTAMMADVSEIRKIQTGEVRDGGYSAVFSLAMRLAISFSLVVSGWCLSAIGYQVPAPAGGQTASAVWKLGLVTFVIGSVICLAALLAIRRYPVTRSRLDEIRAGGGDAPAPVHSF
jgi:GPH family glycoside/pentoside/hexuronide:cation symporter